MLDLCVCDAENKLYENGLIKEKDKVKFVIDNCAVVEKNIDGYYIYLVYNLMSLKKKQISKRKKSITTDNYELLAQKIKEFDLYKSNITLTQTRYERARNMLLHIFSYILPMEGLTFRKNQCDLAIEMLNGLYNKNISLMEAEVGTGKTHAYIMAAIIYNLFYNITSTIIISTSTIALQRAITEEYIPQISGILMKYKVIHKPLNCVVRKGKSHYVCDLKLKTYLNSLEQQKDELPEHLRKVLKRIHTSNDTHIDLDTYPLTRYIKDKICVTNKCGEHCSKYATCRFISFTQKCMYNKFNFQITNHNYVFADLLSYNPLLPSYNLIIFDEAHKLYDVAKQMYGCYINSLEIKELITIVSESKVGTLIACCCQIDELWQKILCRATNNKLFKGPYERVKVNIDGFCESYINKLIEAITNIVTLLYDYEDEKLKTRKRRIRKMCSTLSDKFQRFLLSEELICWAENDCTVYSLCSIPKELSKLVYENFWNRNVLSILTSGTLSVNKDFSLIKKKLGVDLVSPSTVLQTSKKSPFDYKKNALIYIPEHISFPDIKSDGYVRRITTEIDMLLKATYGHSLILFTSYRLMEAVFNDVSKNNYDYPLFIMGKGRIDALKSFKISGNGVLFASDAAGEGVDIVGDTLSNLIIVKLPFAVPDPISDYEQSVMGDLNVYLNKINTPNMIIKLKQYAGRLIRSESDTGIVAILDSRVNSEGKYRKIVLDSLFNAPVTNKITDVEEFIIDKKDASYFA